MRTVPQKLRYPFSIFIGVVTSVERGAFPVARAIRYNKLETLVGEICLP